MPIALTAAYPTLLVRRAAFERVGLTRAALDARFGLTPDEFQVEGDLIALGPLVGEDTLTDTIAELERMGLTYFDDFFDLSGNWPTWLRLYAAAMSAAAPTEGGRPVT